MQRAPAISIVVERPLFLCYAILVLWLLGTFALITAFALQHMSLKTLFGGLVTQSIAATWASWTAWQHSYHGQLSWDGANWHWGNSNGSLSIVLDWQTMLLLQARHKTGKSSQHYWLWLQENTYPLDTWLAIRRAIFSSAQPSAHIQPSHQQPLFLP